jgi:hypothetical protein
MQDQRLAAESNPPLSPRRLCYETHNLFSYQLRQDLFCLWLENSLLYLFINPTPFQARLNMIIPVIIDPIPTY